MSQEIELRENIELDDIIDNEIYYQSFFWRKSLIGIFLCLLILLGLSFLVLLLEEYTMNSYY